MREEPGGMCVRAVRLSLTTSTATLPFGRFRYTETYSFPRQGDSSVHSKSSWHLEGTFCDGGRGMFVSIFRLGQRTLCPSPGCGPCIYRIWRRAATTTGLERARIGERLVLDLVVHRVIR